MLLLTTISSNRLRSKMSEKMNGPEGDKECLEWPNGQLFQDILAQRVEFKKTTSDYILTLEIFVDQV